MLYHPRQLSLTGLPAVARRQAGREPGPYASPVQCSSRLRHVEALCRSHRIPMINSAAKSVTEMSTVILQSCEYD